MEGLGLQLAYRFLDYELNENALFLLDRLHAQDLDNACWIHLRSLCCLRLGRLAAACEYSRDKGLSGEHLGCSYVFAQACLQQKQYRDGIVALERARPLWAGRGYRVSGLPEVERFVPDAASVNRLLGKLYRASGELRNAVTLSVASIEADVFMWDVFTGLCDGGTPLHVSNIFRPKVPSEKSRGEAPTVPLTSKHAARQNTDAAGDPILQDIFVDAAKVPPGTSVTLPVKRKQGQIPGDFAIEPKSLGHSSNSRKTTTSSTIPMRQRRSARLNQASKHAVITDQHAMEPSVAGDGLKNLEISRKSKAPTLRKTLVTGQKAISATLGAVPNVTRGHRLSKTERPPEPSLTAPTLQEEDHLKQLSDLFLQFGTAYYKLKRFQPQACLDILTSLPTEQQASPWVISKVARSQYEMLLYKESKSTFQVLRKIAPSWMEDLEIYSTVLWHLSDDVLLAYHAHELVEDHFPSPQAWCAVGNSFSLQKSRDEAIKCFRRATQLHPQLAHSYSLLGHEYHDAEQYSQANTAFRRAIQVDARHYTAWVGLGKVQEKLGTWDAALKNYLRAEKINPTNGILLTSIARVLDKLGNPRLGLTYMQRASKLNQPEKLSALTKLQTAKLLLRLNSPTEALRELLSAQQIAPDEAEVHFLLGKAYSLLGSVNRNKALGCFTVALSLNPRNQAIKDAIISMEGK